MLKHSCQNKIKLGTLINLKVPHHWLKGKGFGSGREIFVYTESDFIFKCQFNSSFFIQINADNEILVE